jgi:hypothetical protein
METAKIIDSTPTGSSKLPNDRATGIGVLRYLAQAPAIRLAALLVLLTTGAVREALHVAAFSSDDLWCHLRTGTWILHNHAIPRTGLFSQLSTSPWIDCSWMYDAFFGAAYGLLGLRAVPLLLMMFKVALAAVTFLIAGGFRNFWRAIALATLTQFALLSSTQPLVLISICFFGLTLHGLLESRRRNELRPLLWLPILFWLWANLDAQFVLGLLLLSMFVVVEISERMFLTSGPTDGDSPRIPLVHLSAVIAACVVAVLITPYSLNLIPAALRSSYSPALFKKFDFMAAMSFRQPEHYALILLLVFAYMALGRQRSHDFFKIVLLTLWAALAFRIQRESWTIILPSIAILGEAIGSHGNQSTAPGPASVGKRYLQVVAGVAIVLAVSFIRLPSNQLLENRLERVLPAQACNYIRSNHLPDPIFNEYAWGGYLMWKLPEYPVSMDERLNLYGDEMSEAYFNVVMGKQRMETLPGFVREQTILLPVNLPMAKALTEIPVLQEQFHEVYRDDIAIVLVRR